jgi:hypothetical protein
VNIHLEVWWLNIRKPYNSLSFFQPTGRTSGAEELGCGTYHLFVDGESVLIRSGQNRNDGFMAVAEFRSISCMADIMNSANLGRLDARSPEELLASRGRFTELSLVMESNKQ